MMAKSSTKHSRKKGRFFTNKYDWSKYDPTIISEYPTCGSVSALAEKLQLLPKVVYSRAHQLGLCRIGKNSKDTNAEQQMYAELEQELKELKVKRLKDLYDDIYVDKPFSVEVENEITKMNKKYPVKDNEESEFCAKYKMPLPPGHVKRFVHYPKYWGYPHYHSQDNIKYDAYDVQNLHTKEYYCTVHIYTIDKFSQIVTKYKFKHITPIILYRVWLEDLVLTIKPCIQIQDFEVVKQDDGRIVMTRHGRDYFPTDEAFQERCDYFNNMQFRKNGKKNKN